MKYVIQSCVFGLLLLGFYMTYMIAGPGGNGALLSMFIGALAAFGGYQYGRSRYDGRDRV